MKVFDDNLMQALKRGKKAQQKETSPQAKRHELSIHVISFCFMSFLFVSRHFSKTRSNKTEIRTGTKTNAMTL